MFVNNNKSVHTASWHTNTVTVIKLLIFPVERNKKNEEDLRHMFVLLDFVSDRFWRVESLIFLAAALI